MVQVTISGKIFEVDFSGLPSDGISFNAYVENKVIPVTIIGSDNGGIEADAVGYNLYVLIGGRPYEVTIGRDFNWIGSSQGSVPVDLRDHVDNQSPQRAISRSKQGGGDGMLKAPIPGLVTKVMVSVGEWVDFGQPLLILEAMKMENEIRAPHAGKVKTLLAFPGKSVRLNELLAEIIE